MKNKYSGKCVECGIHVPAGSGMVRTVNTPGRRKFEVLCGDPKCGTVVDEFRIGHQTFTRNARGKCEDAPCCGCCTI